MRTKRQTWRSIFPVVVLLLFCFITRLFRLTLLPMFVDEGTHFERAIKMMQEGPFFDSGGTGKFFVNWIIGLMVALTGNNLLWAGRFVSVGFGMLGLIGCYLLGQRLFNRRVGLVGAGLYLAVPYTFFYDRIALADGPMMILVIYLVLVSLEFARRPNVRFSLGMGVLLMFIIMTKLNGFVYGTLPLLVMAIYLPRSKWTQVWKELLLVYSIGALGFIPSLLHFSMHWDLIWRKVSVSQSGENSLGWNWLPNANNMFDYLTTNLSWPVFIIVCLGVAWALIRRQRAGLLLIVCAGITLALFVFTPKPWAWFPRYLLPAVPPLFLLAGQVINLGLDWLRSVLTEARWRNVVIPGLALIVVGPALWFDYWLLADPTQAPFCELDQSQFITGASAGYGLLEVSAYLRDQVSSAEHIVIVYARRPSALSLVVEAYLHDQREHILSQVVDFATADPALLSQRLQAQTVPVFIITSDPPPALAESKINFDTWPYIQRVAHFERPGGSTGVNIYTKKP